MREGKRFLNESAARVLRTVLLIGLVTVALATVLPIGAGCQGRLVRP